jgi:hypothetical protein
MAAFLASKTASELVQRAYTVPLDKDDNIASVATSGTGVTVVSTEIEDGEVLINLSGGTAAQTGQVVLTVTTDEGRTLIETLYIPIVESAAQIAATAGDFAAFALRRIVGIGETPGAAEQDDALERLNAMVASWRAQGADIGAAFPIEASTVLYCPDYAVEALRYNLLMDCMSLYGEQPTPMEAMKARQGLSLVKNMNLPDERAATYF